MCLNVCDWVEVVDRNKDNVLLTLRQCKLSRLSIRPFFQMNFYADFENEG